MNWSQFWAQIQSHVKLIYTYQNGNRGDFGHTLGGSGLGAGPRVKLGSKPESSQRPGVGSDLAMIPSMKTPKLLLAAALMSNLAAHHVEARKVRGQDYNPAPPARPVLESVQDLGVELKPKAKWQMTMTPVAGVAFSDATGSGTGDTRFKTGFSGGAWLDLGKSHWAISTGLLYKQMGFLEENNQIFRETQMDYLSLPVMAKWLLKDRWDRSNFYIKGGLLLSYLVSSNSYLEISRGNGIAPMTFNNPPSTEPRNSFDWGPSIALGGSFEIATGVLVTAEALYYRGLNPVFSINGNDWFNTGFTLSGGLTFPLL